MTPKRTLSPHLHFLAMSAVFVVALVLQYSAGTMNQCFSETAQKSCIQWSFILQAIHALVIVVALPLLFVFKPHPAPQGFFRFTHRTLWALLLVDGLIVACGLVMVLVLFL